ncbi:MAG: BA14K family protein, partial [Brevundimonas sp.]
TALSTAPAVAQTWYDAPTRYDHPRDGGYQGRDAYRDLRAHDYGARYDFNGQADRPGDYRCDAYWDAARTDCGAAWRDQRPTYARRYRSTGYGYGYSSGPSVYPGAYGRPDLIYPGGGSSYGYGAASYGHGRDSRRMDWCRSAYRSYDPASGYYRTYDGRLVFCG